jgi:uncharacterized protein YcbX
MIRLSSIWIYPVKGLRGIQVTEAEVVRRGLRHDRRWLLVDEAGRVVTQREVPQMTLLRTEIAGETLTVTAPSGQKESLPLRPEDGPRAEVQIWSDRTMAMVHPQATPFFAAALGRALRPVFMPEDVLRPVNPAFGQPGDLVSFADGYPLLIASSASLADLNTRLRQPVPMTRFRPNLVVDGCGPFEEDRWARFRLGDVTFRGVKPCGRCVVVTIDPETAQMNKEPLATLASYRRVGNSVNFGVNLTHEGRGTVRVGDALTPL